MLKGEKKSADISIKSLLIISKVTKPLEPEVLARSKVPVLFMSAIMRIYRGNMLHSDDILNEQNRCWII